MKFKDMLYRRQYKIQLCPDTPLLDLNFLKDFGIWSNPADKKYILTLQSTDDLNNDPNVFEYNFRKKTDLHSNECQIEAKYGPLTFQNGIDSSWF